MASVFSAGMVSQDMTSESTRSDALRVTALDQMRRNTRTGWDAYYRKRYHYVQPSPGRYKRQWFWDSCFHVIALARLDVELARAEFETLLAHQDEDGFIGHIMFWGRLGRVAGAFSFQGRCSDWRAGHTAMIQPPLLPHALLALWSETRDLHMLEAYLPKVAAYYDWLRRNRTVGNDGLIGVISPYETGLDNSPAYDALLGAATPTRRGLLWRNWTLDRFNARLGDGFDYAIARERDRFVMIDPFMNAVYCDALDVLSFLYSTVGDELSASATSRLADETLRSLNSQCWDEELGRWSFLAGSAKRPVETLTVASIMPLICGRQDGDVVESVVVRYLTDPLHFGTPFPVPSVAASEPTYDADGESCIWRGPVGLNLNWLIARGLRRHGFDEQARRIEAKSVEMASREFREFYSPNTGDGMRGREFGWSTVAVDMPTRCVVETG